VGVRKKNPASFNSGLGKFEWDKIKSAVDQTCKLGGPLPSSVSVNE